MNNSQLTPQQQELKKRLEEIRRKRSDEPSPQQNEKNKTTRRNAGKRNERQQKKTSPKKKPAQLFDSPTPAVSNGRQVETTQAIVKTEIGAPRTKKRKTRAKSKTRSNSTLVKQLTHADSLKNAIILNEVVSKPVALRYRNR